MRRTHIVTTAILLAAFAVPATSHALGAGVAIGRTAAPSNHVEGNARSVFGRVSLLGSLDLELHYARVDVDATAVSARRLGAGLHLDVIRLGRWVPYLVAGLGLIQGEGPANDHAFDEIGLGVGVQLAGPLALELDGRQGNVRAIDDDAPVDTQRYRQIQLGLSVNF